MTEAAADKSLLAIEARDVWKAFERTQALSGVAFALRRGEIHALVGANGAGKSTFSRIVSGHLAADRGDIRLFGEGVRFASARDAIRAGVTMVMQETSLAPDLSVLENIYLPEFGAPGRLSWKALAARAEALLDQFGQKGHLPLGRALRDLSASQRQMVEILKALALDAKVIIFDEPTASFSPNEVDRLFDVMRLLTQRGKSLVFVSHRLEEIFEITDRITVFREGAAVAEGVPTSGMRPTELVRLMVGREIADIYARGAAGRGAAWAGAAVLDVEHLAAGPRVKDVSFSVAAGEILGLAGLVGAGRSECVEAIFGLRRVERGEIRLAGAPFRARAPIDAIRAGIGFIPEDRRRQGLVQDFTVRENLLLAHLGRRRGIGLGYDERRAQIEVLLDELSLSPRILDDGILTLSGGMQQKVVLARWILMSPKLLILDEPTRGVDIGTRSTIYAMIRRLAQRGTGVLLVSSDFEEVIGVSDRIVVMSDGTDVTSIPSRLVDVEKLAMFAAPRSSAEATHFVLEELVARFGGVAYWISLEGERLYCFDAVAAPEAPEIGFARGTFPEIAQSLIPRALERRSETFLAEPAGASVLVPLRGHRGHDLGHVGLTLPPSSPLPDPLLVRRIALAGAAATTAQAVAGGR
ncbi:MAG TPA: sugar ABC transporter ATP-binding protein [Stellaceae bacterium]|nr:sugar ABC transporter ATP-binding protein [Stellaceae bacterium]